MNKKIAIYTTDKSYAKKKIDELIEKYHETDIIKYHISSTNIEVQMKDGNYYYWISPYQSSKGVKHDISYIDIDTCSLDIIKYIIIPCSKKDFVILTSDYIKYDLNTLIDRLEKIRAIKGNLTNVGFNDEEYGWSNIFGVYVDKDNCLSLTSGV